MAKFRQAYPTDLNDTEWSVIAQLLPQPKKMGRPRKHTYREILNAIFYIVRSGCAWRLMAHDLPPWKTVCTYFRRWRKDGTWERLMPRCGKPCVRNRGATRNPALPFWTANPSKPWKVATSGATMLARKSLGASGECSRS